VILRSRSWLCPRPCQREERGCAGSVGFTTVKQPRNPLPSEKRSRYKAVTCLCVPKPCSHVFFCFSGQNTGQAPKTDAETASSSRRDAHQVLRSTYLNDVKRALNKSTYSRFYEALLAYKKTDNYDAMISVIAALTTERPEDFHLLQSKGCFFKITFI